MGAWPPKKFNKNSEYKMLKYRELSRWQLYSTVSNEDSPNSNLIKVR